MSDMSPRPPGALSATTAGLSAGPKTRVDSPVVDQPWRRFDLHICPHEDGHVSGYAACTACGWAHFFSFPGDDMGFWFSRTVEHECREDRS